MFTSLRVLLLLALCSVGCGSDLPPSSQPLSENANDCRNFSDPGGNWQISSHFHHKSLPFDLHSNLEARIAIVGSPTEVNLRYSNIKIPWVPQFAQGIVTQYFDHQRFVIAQAVPDQYPDLTCVAYLVSELHFSKTTLKFTPPAPLMAVAHFDIKRARALFEKEPKLIIDGIHFEVAASEDPGIKAGTSAKGRVEIGFSEVQGKASLTFDATFHDGKKTIVGRSSNQVDLDRHVFIAQGNAWKLGDSFGLSADAKRKRP